MGQVRAALMCALVFFIFAGAAHAQNSAPVFTPGRTASVEENTTRRIVRPAASDPDGDAVAITIDNTADGRLFQLDSGGYLRFIAPADFEAPQDRDRNNVYVVRVRASDGSLSRAKSYNITVTDLPEGTGFRVRRVAVGLSQPLFLLGRGDGSNRVFIVEKGGQVEILNLATGLLNPTPFLDVSSSISTAGEQGLLGMALSPDFATSGVFYVHVNNTNGDTEIRRYRTQVPNRDLADAASGDVIFFADQPAATNHKGGWIGFGPDNLLYIALGDGGGGNDPFGNGQNRNSLLAKMLRIDPSADGFPADARRDYRIPAGNPFAGGGGAPEVLAWGLRNPFRASFDRQTGNLFIGDVGQDAIEEISLIRPGEAGLNFGWPILEGTRVNQPGSTAGMTPPVAEYGHGTGPRQGNSVTGGYVYRGPVASLRNQYIFGDFVNDQIWSAPAGSAVQGQTIASSAFIIRTPAFAPDLGVIDGIASFGEDDAANLYIIGIDGEVFRVEPR
jgi:glucose/arabinose dehydrogenase